MLLKIITSKLAGPIAGGVAVLLALVLAFSTVSKNREINKLTKENTSLNNAVAVARANELISKANATALEGGLAACSASVINAKQVADAVARSGVAAVEQVQKAGATAAKQAAAIQSMPQATCDDALAILKSGGK